MQLVYCQRLIGAGLLLLRDGCKVVQSACLYVYLSAFPVFNLSFFCLLVSFHYFFCLWHSVVAEACDWYASFWAHHKCLISNRMGGFMKTHKWKVQNSYDVALKQSIFMCTMLYYSTMVPFHVCSDWSDSGDMCWTRSLRHSVANLDERATSYR